MTNQNQTRDAYVELAEQLQEAIESAENSADWLDDGEAEAAAELAEYGFTANYAGLYSVPVIEIDGVISRRVFDSALAALLACREYLAG